MDLDLANSLFALLGKSERDDAVKAMLQELKIKQPLKRPAKGEDYFGFTLFKGKFSINFILAESVVGDSDKYADGELLFGALFVHLNKCKIPSSAELPLGISCSADRAKIRATLGTPGKVNELFNSDHWWVGNIHVSVDFDEDSSVPNEVYYGLATLEELENLGGA